jgi:hypothetical protein
LIKDQYLVQPYEVGSKKYKSLAVIIPSKIVNELGMDRSTGFILKSDRSGIKLNLIDTKEKKEMPVDSSIAAEQSTDMNLVKEMTDYKR